MSFLASYGSIIYLALFFSSLSLLGQAVAPVNAPPKAKGIGIKSLKINTLPAKLGKKEISPGVLDLGIEKDTEISGIGMGMLSDRKPRLNQRGFT